ncbi:sulfite exporter TauE/SafE family protein [Mucilaginibacter myungsuensis]|uniref:Sulfite exporter TauE/SafE family protein n=1 Tax=Mucilaginibacter myungsuensis TaxID=649104 RepID=A0A929PZJ1_9SPHI|nr:sulfite exporter TauE/SafE family protein [Mucilaginibacter myungsuensis]MBE9664477.1 sulfite exporter TauE/SafE family protein [Mucilaginibacter myungsuensis]MDN3601378.1 sulfite exporter TauE/SafE family protein [Mucilaginibacter myungsuensis]
MSTAQIAFFIGLFGSVHCVGMCGPLAFAVPVSKRVWWYIVSDKILYNLGRVISYTLLGFLIGFVGRQLWISGMQQGVSLLSGLLIIFAGLSRIFKFKLSRSNRSMYDILPINKALNYVLKHRAGHLIIGIINGFLPCGFVYIALVGAINTNAPIAAAEYMFWFGLGTFPLMLIATVSAASLGPLVRTRINKAMPYLMVCLGLWFIVRGSGLNVPYLSVAKMGNGVVCE